MRRTLSGLILAMGLFGLAACSTNPSRQDIGTATGAVVGGVLGSALTGGNGVGTVGGAAVGGVIGNQIGKDLDQRR